MDATRRSVNERRRALRYGAPVHGVSAARIRGGHAAAIVNLASGGACLETARRLLPGAHIDITLVRQDGSTSHGCRVLRCAIVRLTADTIAFRAAVQFNRSVPWFASSAIVVQSLSGVAMLDADGWLTGRHARPLRVHERPEDDDA